MNLKEKVKLLGTQPQLARFLQINPFSVNRCLSKDKFNSIAVNMVIDLLLGLETEESIKEKFKDCYIKPKKAGRPKKSE